MSIDTLRPDMLGCYGYERPTSPPLPLPELPEEDVERLRALGYL